MTFLGSVLKGGGEKKKRKKIISGKLLDLMDILGFSQELKDGILYGISVFLRGE